VIDVTLRVLNLMKSFGGVRAIKGISFEVHAGECVALIGPNGAGKSTSFACIAGQHHLTGGQVLWAGERIDGLTPASRLKRGVTRTFQVAQTFEALTVRQNVQLLLQSAHGLSAWNVLDQVQRETAEKLLARVGLLDSADAEVPTLPYGARKRLELALALAGIQETRRNGGARLLLLDEPAAGLSGTERSALMKLVKSLVREKFVDTDTDTGAGAPAMAVLYTEHNMDAVFGVADRVLVLIEGELAAQGSPHEIAQNQMVRTRYLGRAGQTAWSGADEGSAR
jgi:branched-chain amino acid transport system ATP-binding protein